MGVIMMPNGNGGFNTIYTPSPAPAKCPNCHKPEDTDTVCNHCGYHYPKPTTSKTEKIFLTVMFTFIFFIIITVIDLFFLHCQAGNSIFIQADNCSYEVPAPYKLLYNAGKEKYVIGVSDIGASYEKDLGGYGSLSEANYINVGPVAYFADSCKAKHFLELYLNHLQSDAEQAEKEHFK